MDEASRKLALKCYDLNAVGPHASFGNQTSLAARRALAWHDQSNYQSRTRKPANSR